MENEYPFTETDIETDDFDNLPEGDGVIVISTDYRIMSVNLQAERILKSRFQKGQSFDPADTVTDEYLPQAKTAIEDPFERRGVRASGPPERERILARCPPQERPK